MADYRGGGRHQTQHGAGLIKAIREGRTDKQRQRNFEQKLAFAAIQAGLQGTRAGIGLASRPDEEDAKRREDLVEYVKTPAPDYKPMATAPDDAVPAWLKEEEKTDGWEFKPNRAGARGRGMMGSQ